MSCGQSEASVGLLAQSCHGPHSLSTNFNEQMSKNLFGLCIATVLPIVVGAQSSRSIGSITGLTVDDRGAPIPGVEVRSGSRATTSAADGRFILDSLDAGPRQFMARRVGYGPESLSVKFDPTRSDTLKFILSPMATNLDRLDVTGERETSTRLQGFERRRERKNGGQFVTRADIDRRLPRETSDIMRWLQGVRMVDSMGVQLPVSTRGQKVDLRTRLITLCVMRVGVDGILKEPYFPMNTITTSDIHGIEVYAGAASLPPEFGGARKDAGCGLIMIWTRSR
jgi:hypothetical protein